MEFRQMKNKKEQLFIRIMSDKYNGVQTPDGIVKEYRYLQREEKRRVRAFKGVA